jgi:hypothetical protein
MAGRLRSGASDCDDRQDLYGVDEMALSRNMERMPSKKGFEGKKKKICRRRDWGWRREDARGESGSSMDGERRWRSGPY